MDAMTASESVTLSSSAGILRHLLKDKLAQQSMEYCREAYDARNQAEQRAEHAMNQAVTLELRADTDARRADRWREMYREEARLGASAAVDLQVAKRELDALQRELAECRQELAAAKRSRTD